MAGSIAVLISYAGSAALVFQAAQAAGASPAQLTSWLWALGMGIGIACIGLSLSTRMPVLIGWSTPGAALLATSLAGLTMQEAVGAFVASSLLTVLIAASGTMAWVTRLIPQSVAAAMLAGILLHFGFAAFTSLPQDGVLVGAMMCVYFAGRKLFPRFVLPATLACGLIVAGLRGGLSFAGVTVAVATPVFTAPHFSAAAVIGVAIPLCLVTMASQNLPGLVVLRAHGYAAPAGRIVGWTGVAGLVLAPFGAFAINLAAITAALCMGEDVDPDPAERYRATVWAGFVYLALGVFAGTIASLLVALPHTLIVAFTGLALLGAITASLGAALQSEAERDASVVTLLVTASGLTLWGVGSAFWGLVLGSLVGLLMRIGRKDRV